MNEHSSRSHLILRLYVQGTNKTTGDVTHAKLSLVDLVLYSYFQALCDCCDVGRRVQSESRRVVQRARLWLRPKELTSLWQHSEM